MQITTLMSPLPLHQPLACHFRFLLAKCGDRFGHVSRCDANAPCFPAARVGTSLTILTILARVVVAHGGPCSLQYSQDELPHVSVLACALHLVLVWCI